MRILYHHRTLADGAEGIHIREMINAFRSLGHEVTIDALAKSAESSAKPKTFAGRIKGMLPQAGFELAAFGYSCLEYLSFRRRLRKERPDLIYKRHALLDAGVVLAAKHERVPLILEVNGAYSSAQHQAFEHVSFKSLNSLIERLVFTSASVVATVSSPLARYVASLSRGRARTLLLPNGANPDAFNLRPDSGSRVRQSLGWEQATVAGWAGILRDWHRLDLLLDAVVGIPELKVLIIGDGPDRPRVEEHIARLHLGDRVHITGRVPHAEMPEYVAALDIAVAADDRTGYASPMKVLEYMAMQRAVVAPRMPNIQDFLTDGHDGLLFTQGSVDSLADTLRRVVEDRTLRLTLGANARRTIETSRNWVQNANTVLATVARPA
jgi:glycosyltransferase involved in cell wall biosynthesis